MTTFTTTSARILTVVALVLLAAAAASGMGRAQEPGVSDPQQFARGAKAWADNCNRCHNLRDPMELTDEDWEVAVTHMRVRGNLPGQVARDIAVFLKGSNN